MSFQRFIIGWPCSRVGSTFFVRLLNSHPEIRITRERRLYRLRFWPRHFTFPLPQLEWYSWISKEDGAEALRAAFRSASAAHPDLSMWHRDAELSVYCIQKVEDALFRADGWGGIVGDKGYFALPPPSEYRTPVIEEALSLFPDMRVLFLYRHPFDVFTSRARRGKRLAKAARGEPSWNSFYKNPGWHQVWSDDFYRHSIDWVEAMARWERIRLTCRSLDIRYEDLKDRPEDVLVGVADFLGVGSAKPMIRTCRKAGSWAHIGYWKARHPEMAAQVHQDIFPTMERYNYSS